MNEYRTAASGDQDLRMAIWNSCQKCGIESDVPLLVTIDDKKVVVDEPDLPAKLSEEDFSEWVVTLSDYLIELQDRLFSSGLHTLGSPPTDDEMLSYLQAYFGDSLDENDCRKAIEAHKKHIAEHDGMPSFWTSLQEFATKYFGLSFAGDSDEASSNTFTEAKDVVSLLSANTEELDSVLSALDGGYVKPAPGGDLLR